MSIDFYGIWISRLALILDLGLLEGDLKPLAKRCGYYLKIQVTSTC